MSDQELKHDHCINDIEIQENDELTVPDSDKEDEALSSNKRNQKIEILSAKRSKTVAK